MGFLERLRGGLARTREVLETPVEDLARGRRPLEPADLDAIEEALIGRRLRAARGGRGAWRCCARAAREISRRRRRGDAPRCCARRSCEPWSGRSRGAVLGASLGRVRGRRQRRGQDHDDRQAGRRPGRREGRTALLVRRRHLPRGGRRAARGLGRSARARRSTAAPRAPIPPRCSPTGCAAAQARGHDAVLVDTAGRLHTKGNLMAELAKMARVAGARGRRARRTRRCWCSTRPSGSERARPGARVRQGRRA